MILSIATQKGGAGKTTTSVTLAAGLARKGKKTLLIDVDYQANATQVLLPGFETLPPHQTLYASILERKPLPIHSTKIPNLDIVPAHILLSSTDVELTAATDHREERLKRQLDPV
jgi:chromosome partitioning protein